MTTTTKLGKVTIDENPALSQDVLFILPDKRPATRQVTIPLSKLVAKRHGRAPTLAQRSSFLNHGILEPLIVSERDDGLYDIHDGRRRYLVAREIGVERLRCQVIESGNPDEIALTVTGTRLENPIGEYNHIRALIDERGLSPTMIMTASGMPLKLIEKRLRFARLIDDVWTEVESGNISVAVAMSMTSLPEESQRRLMSDAFDKKGTITPADVAAERRRIQPPTGNQAGLGDEFDDDAIPDDWPRYRLMLAAMRALAEIVISGETFQDADGFDPLHGEPSDLLAWAEHVGSLRASQLQARDEHETVDQIESDELVEVQL